MRNLSDILGDEKKFRPYLNEYRYSKKLSLEWPSVMGPLSAQLRFSYLKDRVLMLETTQVMWVNEIAFYKDQILEKVNIFFLGKYKVKQVKVQFSKKKETVLESKAGYIGFSLEEKIKAEDERKLALGYVLCRYCRDVYTEDGVCVFCRSAVI